MKNRRSIAIILCIGIITSSLGGSLVSLAKDNKREGFQKYDTSTDESMTKVLPTADLLGIEPVYNSENISSNKWISATDDEILYVGTKSTLDPEEMDMFHIGEEEIKELMQNGYSVADIFEADKIANELFIEPQVLLEEKAVSNKSLDQIKKDLLEESREKTTISLKEKYNSEYKELKSKKLKDKDIIRLLAYADINNLDVSDQLVKEYQKSGDKLFKQEMDELSTGQLSQETKRKQKISDSAEQDLSEEIMDKLEILSQKTGKPVEDLVRGYMKNDNKKK